MKTKVLNIVPQIGGESIYADPIRFGIRSTSYNHNIELNNTSIFVSEYDFTYTGEAVTGLSTDFSNGASFFLSPFNDLEREPFSNKEASISKSDYGILLTTPEGTGSSIYPSNMIRFVYPRKSSDNILSHEITIDPMDINTSSWGPMDRRYQTTNNPITNFSGLAAGFEILSNSYDTAVTAFFNTDGTIDISGPPDELGERKPFITYSGSFLWYDGPFSIVFIIDKHNSELMVVATRDNYSYDLCNYIYSIDDANNYLPDVLHPQFKINKDFHTTSFVVNDSPDPEKSIEIRGASICTDSRKFLADGNPSPGSIIRYTGSSVSRYYNTLSVFPDMINVWRKEGSGGIVEYGSGSSYYTVIKSYPKSNQLCLFVREDERLSYGFGFDITIEGKLITRTGNLYAGFGFGAVISGSLIFLAFCQNTKSIRLLTSSNVTSKSSYKFLSEIEWSADHSYRLRYDKVNSILNVFVDGALIESVELDELTLPVFEISDSFIIGSPYEDSSVVESKFYLKSLSNLSDINGYCYGLDETIEFNSEDDFDVTDTGSYIRVSKENGSDNCVFTAPFLNQSYPYSFYVKFDARLNSFSNYNDDAFPLGNTGFGVDVKVPNYTVPLRFMHGSDNSVCCPEWLSSIDEPYESNFYSQAINGEHPLRVSSVDWSKFNTFEIFYGPGEGLNIKVNGEIVLAYSWNKIIEDVSSQRLPRSSDTDYRIDFGFVDFGYYGSFDFKDFVFSFGDGFDFELIQKIPDDVWLDRPTRVIVFSGTE